ncbi:hypothetical protein [Shewanella sp. UCD-KL21]|uniref:hypothetical protein n=1 Tax=Shewanella sp. UCD-KL21 TaxID=1917164 RepID=UPI000970C825|nr:hypothetical protein [Shewanella sp. UCD-KL21]
MSTKLTHQLIVFITLFAILGQGLITNGYAMVANPLVHSPAEMLMSNDNTSQTNLKQSKSTEKPNCHSSMTEQAPQKTTHCCDDSSMLQSKKADQSCCDSQNGCAIDCGHCITISMTGHLLTFDILLAKAVNSKADATAVPHFFFHKPLPAFRPPIS